MGKPRGEVVIGRKALEDLGFVGGAMQLVVQFEECHKQSICQQSGSVHLQQHKPVDWLDRVVQG